ncbi:MAG: hypothetical protein EAX89_11265 [Candidatus Lokiarchaeota archaeon]|nr:hypothetical protein [Candidatus Lokiarchaeota archaeon]
MPCIHGIDEINCPICRISNVSVPKNSISKIEKTEAKFLIKSPFLDNYSSNQEVYEKEFNNRSNPLQPNLINPLPRPSIINQIPPFENKSLLEQLNKQDLEKIDVHGTIKKIPMKKGELEFK